MLKTDPNRHLARRKEYHMDSHNKYAEKADGIFFEIFTMGKRTLFMYKTPL